MDGARRLLETTAEQARLKRAVMEQLEAHGLDREVQEGTFAFGDPEHFVAGVVKSIGYAQKEGMRLYVTAERYRGKKIERLDLKPDQTCEAIADDHGEVIKFPGTFVML